MSFAIFLLLSSVMAITACYGSGERQGNSHPPGDADATSESDTGNDHDWLDATGPSDPVDGIEEPDLPIPGDEDGDGHASIANGGDDCDDSRPDVHPGAAEVCLDGVDEDCDGLVDGVSTIGEPLTIAVGRWIDADLAWTGSEYAVAWIPCEVCYEGIFDVWLARLDGDGDPVAEPATVGFAYNPHSIDLEWNGSGFGLVGDYLNDAGEDCLYYAPLDASGTLAGTLADLGCTHGGIFDITACSSPGKLSVAYWAGDHRPDRWVHYLAIDNLGAVLQGPLREVPDDGYWANGSFTIESTGSSDALAWVNETYDPAEAPMLLLDIVHPDETSSGPLVTVARLESLPATISMSWTGSELGMVHFSYPDGESSRLLYTSVSEEGELLEGPVEVMSTFDGRDPFLSWSGSEYGLAWSSLSPDGVPSIEFTTMSSEGVMGAGRADMSIDALSDQDAKRQIVWTGSEFGVLYSTVGTAYEDGETRFQRIGFCD